MALILETGAGIANAESLVDLVFLKAFAGSRGKVISNDDTVLEQQLRLAHDYLLTLESSFKGYRTFAGQALPFPRQGVVIHGLLTASNIIPVLVKQAICQLVIDGAEIDLLPNVTDGRVVTQETVGPISTTYAITGSVISLPRVHAFLFSFLLSSTGLRSIRV